MATLLTVILTVQVPLALALTCVTAPMSLGNASIVDAVEEKCHEMVAVMTVGSGVDFSGKDFKIKTTSSGQHDDFKLCQSDCCCVVLPAPAIRDESIVNPAFRIETLTQNFTGRLVSTYLKSNLRPPIS